jgi:hypothetical protein
MRHFRVRNWDKFQHYKNRNPPWIKLHTELLENYDFARLPDASKLLALCIWMLAARSDNKIPADPVWVQSKCNIKSKVDLQPLFDGQFIEWIQELPLPEQDASKMLARCEQSACSEERRDRGETEVELNGHETVVPTDVTLVFDHWRTTHEHPKSKLDHKREKVIRVALKLYTPEQLCTSITGYKNSAYHMGQNESHKKFDDIELFLRDAKRIDAGLEYAEKGQEQKWQ